MFSYVLSTVRSDPELRSDLHWGEGKGLQKRAFSQYPENLEADVCPYVVAFFCVATPVARRGCIKVLILDSGALEKMKPSHNTMA